MDAIEILKDKLMGNFYSRISLGDTFDLYFDNFWLISQNVVSSDENTVNENLSKYLPTIQAIDKEDVAKGTILTATRRKEIKEVSLNSDSSLELSFENAVRLKFTTDTEIVDWQWALNVNGSDPYIECVIGCFNSGEIHVGNC